MSAADIVGMAVAARRRRACEMGSRRPRRIIARLVTKAPPTPQSMTFAKGKALDYRPEIDGLRALAVIPVILYHAGFDAFRGGFVGVDVFFVISGYLITTLILGEQRAGTFTIAGFYERRARRILPALFFVMLASMLAAWLWMLPDQMREFSQSLIAVSAFVANLYFRNTSGYFDALAAE